MEKSNLLRQEAQIKRDFHQIVYDYLHLKTNNSEMEIRFRNHPTKKLTKMDYDNVAKQLYLHGYECTEPHGSHLLRISPIDANITDKGDNKRPRMRVEIAGIELIEDYCKLEDDLSSLMKKYPNHSNQIRFTIKSLATTVIGPIENVSIDNFGLQISFQNEDHSKPHDPRNAEVLSSWKEYKKTYRFLNRVRFRHPKLPFFVDLSIIRSSPTKGDRPIPKFSLREAGVFQNQETYEIEMELDNERIMLNNTSMESWMWERKHSLPSHTAETLLPIIRNQIRIILTGLQNTPYPIGFQEMDDVLHEYMRLIHGPSRERGIPIKNRDFIGPSSYTLQIDNILSKEKESTHNSIRENYCVTDKADGSRALLFVSEKNRIYMIDTNMNVIFTGITLGNNDSKVKFQGSLLDGEFIKYDKDQNVIYLFAAFDIYYYHTKCVSNHWFEQSIPEDSTKTVFRHEILKQFIEELRNNIHSVVDDKASSSCKFRIQCKKFVKATSIFSACKEVYSESHEYNTDGLIFTPTNASVGGQPGTERKDHITSKLTWEYSFKWKPPEFNTIDFLVKVKKDEKGNDLVSYSNDFNGTDGLNQYKTLVLHCGYSKKQHGYSTSPLYHIIEDTQPLKTETENTDLYRPVPFAPTRPPDDNARFCHVSFGNADGVMKTEEGEYFDSNTIIEFRYDPNREGCWKWIPLRVRHDKTQELLSNAAHKSYGNDFRVANNNWTSIHNPITYTMITTGDGIPMHSVMDDVYYNKGDKVSITKPLRDFHNLYVKRQLITSVARHIQGNKTLIDFAVGKAGDLSKWIGAKIDMVFGIDVMGDNIENHLNGACARYMDEKMRYRDPKTFKPDAIFVKGNSGLNIRNGDAFIGDGDGEATTKDISNKKYAQIANAVFGSGGREEDILGKGIYKHYGVGRNGFNISSCQFALHYFFENKETTHSFMRNVCECTATNGYFIGTCYDGLKIFDVLRNKHRGESFTLFSQKDGTKIVEITKSYTQTGFDGDSENCLGYPIHVFQETINKTFKEYLVNFEYMTRLMELYGFDIISKEHAKELGLPAGTGLFHELYNTLEIEVKSDPRKKNYYGQSLGMSQEEKTLSFLNRYFVFQKKRENINTESIFNMMNVTTTKTRTEYEPAKKSAKEPVAKESAKEPAKESAKESAKEPAAKESAKEPAAKESAKEPAAKESAKEAAAKESAKEAAIEKPKGVKGLKKTGMDVVIQPTENRKETQITKTDNKVIIKRKATTPKKKPDTEPEK